MGLSRIDTAEEVISEVENKSEESIHMGQKHGERKKYNIQKRSRHMRYNGNRESPSIFPIIIVKFYSKRREKKKWVERIFGGIEPKNFSKPEKQ